MRLQLAFRESGEIVRGKRLHIAFGLVRAPIGRLPEEKISTFLVASAAGGMHALVHVPGRISDPATSDDYDFHPSRTADEIVQARIWPIPTDGQNLLMLHLRRTRVPAHADGEEVLLASGLVIDSSNLAVDHDAIHVFDGDRAAMRLENLPSPPLVAATAGSRISQILGKPFWGFGNEPVAMRSTMHLDVIDKLDEYNRIQFTGSPDGADKQRFEVLDRELRPYALDRSSRRDGDYIATMRHLFSVRPDLVGSSADVMTAAQMADRDEAMRASLQAVMSEGPRM